MLDKNTIYAGSPNQRRPASKRGRHWNRPDGRFSVYHAYEGVFEDGDLGI